MKQSLPGSRAAIAAPGQNRRLLIIVAVAAVVLALVIRACSGHENRYESITHSLNAALQANDLAAVEKLQNAETATHVNRARVGEAADKLAPLGKIKSVKEQSAGDLPAGMHAITVTFDKGVADERLKFDPENKIVSFRYEIRPTTK